MADNGVELRQIVWSQAFPFVRLFRSLRLALGFHRLALGLACLLVTYIGGCLLDGIWGTDGGVPVVNRGTRLQTEIEAYARLNQEEFTQWQDVARSNRQTIGVRGLRSAGLAKSQTDALAKLEADSLRDLLLTDEWRQKLADLRERVDQQFAAGRRALEANTAATAETREERRATLTNAADELLTTLSTDTFPEFLAGANLIPAIATIAQADPDLEPAAQQKLQNELREAVTRQMAWREYDQLEPKGPFRALLVFEQRCFAGAIQGVASLNLGFSGGPFSERPAMAASIAAAGRGVWWLLIYRPFYTILFGVLVLVTFAYFGGAICRSAAMQSAREESLAWNDALSFAREKFSGFITAPLLPIGLFVGIALLVYLGGLIGVIPFLGELITSIAYPLALLGGFALAMILLALVLGFHLMWPTIAVEGSDGFDALSRACSYVSSRIWHVAFYAFTLLVHGALGFMLVRLVAALTLKLAHSCTKGSMNLVSSGELHGMGKLDAIWQMPAWADIAILPTVMDPAYYGTFHNAPLTAGETGALFFFRCWVYLVVGVVGAFVISYFFCGSTMMYFLLRRDVDATDYDEIYYEETEEDVAATTVPTTTLPSGPARAAADNGSTPPPDEPPAESPPPTAPPSAEPPADETRPPAGSAEEKPPESSADEEQTPDAGESEDESPGEDSSEDKPQS